MSLLRFIKQSTLVHVWLWCILLISAIIIVALQFCTLVIWPLSKRLYRDVNGVLIQLFWFQYVWLADYWCGAKLILHCKPEDVPFVGKEDFLFVLNHRSDVDWIAVWQLGARFNLLPGGKAVMKHELKYVPFLGWSFWLTEQIFLKRNYAKDKESLLKQLHNITTYHVPTTTIIFCEGTRYTEEKYRLSQAFAKERGIPCLKHHLVPRTKGFALCTEAYRGKNFKMYDGTLAYETGKTPTMFDLLSGKKYDCHLYARRFPLDDVPADDVDEFCHEMYRGKDEAFDHFLKHNTFEGFDAERPVHIPPRPWNTLIIMTGWMIIVGLPLLYYAFVILTSGSIFNVLITAAVLYAVMRLCQYLVFVSQSKEKSSYGLKEKTG